MHSRFQDENLAPAPGAQSADDVSAGFVDDLLNRLASDNYTAGAWRRFFSVAYRRARTNIYARPRRRQSFFRWAGLAGGSGLALAVLGSSGQGLTEIWLAIGWYTLWYLLLAGWTYLHLGLIRSEEGAPFDSFLIPNGLSLIRLCMTPLLGGNLLNIGTDPTKGAILLIAAWLILATDFFDGLIARRLGQTSRFGRLLDPMADLLVITALTIGLFRFHGLSWLPFTLIMMRYPGLLIAGFWQFFRIGPIPISATRLGKVTHFVVATTLWVHLSVPLLRLGPTHISISDYLWYPCSVLIAANLLVIVRQFVAKPK